jgi:copper chaperone NosL
MTLLSIETAAQIAAPGLEPIVFDDLGCLREYLRAHPLPPDALVFVADHRTGMWLEARHALLTRAAVRTPMDSRVIAHADRESREADPDALHGEPLTVKWLLLPEKKEDKP